NEAELVLSQLRDAEEAQVGVVADDGAAVGEQAHAERVVAADGELLAVDDGGAADLPRAVAGARQAVGENGLPVPQERGGCVHRGVGEIVSARAKAEDEAA